MEILASRLHPDAVLPGPAYHGDAGWDLVAVETLLLGPRGGRGVVGTGLAVAIPEGYGGFVLPRSGLAARHGVTCVNSPGLIDSGYRGELRVALVNLDPDEEYVVNPGDRIAQLVVLELASFSLRLVRELPESHRGHGGFGSSGR